LNNEEQMRYEDEIDISELISVLFKRWILIITVTIIAVIVGMAYCYTKTVKYKTSAVVELGEYQDSAGNYKFIQSPKSTSNDLKVISRKVSNQYVNESDKEHLGFNIKEDFEAEVLEGSGAIEVFLTAPKDFDSVSFMNKVFNKLKTKHDLRFKEILDKKDLFKEQINQSTDRINDLLKAKRNVVSDPKEPIALLLFNSEIQNLRSYINNLQEKVINLENITNTQLAIEPDISDNPVSPKYKLFFALSLVLGVFLGVFSAFLREFWVNNKNKILGKESD